MRTKNAEKLMTRLSFFLILFFVTESFSQLYFDKDFDSGSLDSAYFSNGYWNINYATTLHFRVRGCTSENPTFRIWVRPEWWWHFRASHRMVWRNNSSLSYNYMDTAWVENGYYYFRNNNVFTADTIFIAYLFPLTYTEIVSYMNTIQSNQWVRDADVRGYSVLGRNIYGFDVTNPNISDSLKSRVVLTSRQHPLETLGNHIVLGMSDYLITSTDSVAVWLRNNCIFSFYPMINPDGVYLGLNTETFAGFNPNRFWFNGDTISSPSPCQETNIVRQDIWERTGNKVHYSFDMHTNSGSLIYYYCGLKTAPEPFSSLAYELVREIRTSDSLINNGNILLPNEILCDTYQSTNYYADFWHWNNKESVAFTLETATVPPQPLERIRNNGIAIAHGLYKVLNVIVTGSEIENLIEPTTFELSQNYPNPFNPSTKIKFTVPVTLSEVEGSLVTLKVYDVLGNQIATLVNEEKPVGSYEVEFNGSGLPSGIYFYMLDVQDKFFEVKKMILLK